MKLIISSVILLSLVGCSSPKLSNKTTAVVKKEKIIFTASEYKKLSKKENDSMSAYYLKLLDKPFVQDKDYDKEYAPKPIKLSKNLNNIVDILKDSHFTKEYDLNELSNFVYKGNKALATFVSGNLHGDDKKPGSTYCVGSSEYLFYLKGNELKVKYLDGESGEIEVPVDSSK